MRYLGCTSSQISLLQRKGCTNVVFLVIVVIHSASSVSRCVFLEKVGFFFLPQIYSEAVDEWLILSNRNFKFVLGDVLPFPSVGLRHMMTGVPDPWLSMLRAGLKAEVEVMDG